MGPAFRAEGGGRTWFETLDEMEIVLDQYLVEYNAKRPHEGRSVKDAPLPPSSTASVYQNTPEPNSIRKAT
jgi:hypothetical protein